MKRTLTALVTVGAIATADEVLSSSEPIETLKHFVNSAFSIGRQGLGA